MARKKIVLTQEEIERRILSGQRIQNYRKSKNLTQAKLAEILDIQDVITIRRYEMNANANNDGKYSPMPKEKAERMERESGIIAAYWMGLTNVTTTTDRIKELKELKEKTEIENAAFDALSQLHELQAEEIQRRKDFFYMCGFRYESIEGTAAADFSFVLGKEPRPHIITNYQDNTPHELTEEQFRELFDKLTDTIHFACYQADKSNAKEV
jgi:transcriptional regulator with XRE-family HTH domain